MVEGVDPIVLLVELLRFTMPAKLLILAVATAMVASSMEVPRAEEVWARAIAAKGGRERLRSIRSVVVARTADWGVRGFNHIHTDYRSLYVPPNRLWEWVDIRPARIGLHLRIVNLATNYVQMAYHFTGKSGEPIVGDVLAPNRAGHPTFNDREVIAGLHAVLFMENEGAAPRLLGIKKILYRLTSVYQIISEQDGCRYEWKIDAKTHLPRSVKLTHGPYNYEILMSQYRDVDGFMLPHALTEWLYSRTFRVSYHVKYQINVAYEESVFDGPPSIADGPTGWKRKAPRQLEERNR